ncbi:family 43 glycosylhydrolase [Paenibacillus sedimenti]|uniref:family 43 glycosylhydrolase n=1 Tax=Paenibacillus sedimenti TaxID=2770274 RepID=UPI001CB74C93|nr:family 43 glycosylhydrolase [Paenibacillus sedimenti]
MRHESMQTNTKPILILPGDYPDPSVVRVGQDYYMTHSSFDYTPGLLIWHPKDLLNLGADRTRHQPICGQHSGSGFCLL